MPVARFCSSCGSPLPAAPPVTCAECGTSHWRNPKPCANAIVVDDGTILLTRRAYAPWQDAWCSPGGFVEVGEHPLETVEREVLEETGVAIEVTDYLGVWVDHYADETSPEDEMINVAYYLAVPSGTSSGAVGDHEVSEIRWFAWDELPDDLAPPGTLAAVLEAARSRPSDGSYRLLDRPR